MKNFIVLFLLSSLHSNLFSADSLALNDVLDRHKNSRDRIVLLSGGFQYVMVQPQQAVIAACDYFRTNEKVKIVFGKDTPARKDTLITNGESRHVSVSKSKDGKLNYNAARNSSQAMLGLVDPWHGMLLSPIVEEGNTYYLEHFLVMHQGKISVAEGPTEKDIILTFDTSKSKLKTRHKITIDKTKNYLLKEYEQITDDTNEKYVAVIEEYTESKPGIFIPTKATRTKYNNGKIVDKYELRFMVKSLNEPILDANLSLPAIPAGTLCRDYTNQTQYKIDKNWKRVSEATPNRIIKVSPPNEDTVEYRTTTKNEPNSFWLYLFYCSLCLFTVGLVLYCLRMRRKSYVKI